MNAETENPFDQLLMVTDFINYPFESEAKKFIQDNLELLKHSQINEEVERRFCGIVCRYLLMNATFSTIYECAVSTMSENLGIPLDSLMKIINVLLNQNIVKRFKYGDNDVVIVVDFNKALEKGYIDLDSKEAPKLLRVISETFYGCYFFPLRVVMKELTDLLIKPHSLEATIDTLSLNLKDFNRRLEVPLKYPREPYTFVATPINLLCSNYRIISDLLNFCDFRTGGIAIDILLELNVPDQVTKEEVRKALKVLIEKRLKLLIKLLKPSMDSIKMERYLFYNKGYISFFYLS